MSIDNIRHHFTEANKVLEEFISNGKNFKDIYSAGNFMLAALLNGHKIISCGNGGSMSDAMHFAEEFTGRFPGQPRSFACNSHLDPAK